MILGHYEIKRRLKKDLKIAPLEDDQVRENGIDLSMNEAFTIEPKSFSLAKTKERVEFPIDLIGFCNLRSTYARKGLFIPPTVVDAGFRGKLIIEVINNSDNPYTFEEGERFLHLIIAECKDAISYKGKYKDQT